MIPLSIIFGTIFGSFANMLIYRLTIKKSILTKHSLCIHCKKKLNWIHLIPIISFIIQKGRCFFCKKHIPYRYIVVECIYIILFFLCLNPLSVLHLNFQFLIFSSICIILFFTDLEHFILPFPLNMSLVILGLYTAIYENTFIELIVPTLGIAFGLLTLRIIFNTIYKKDTFGIGDIILLCGITINWGWHICLGSFYIAIILGGIYSCILLILKKKSRLDYIPFSPFIIIGFILSYFLLPSLAQLLII